MRLKELREMENLTQEEFAHKHNITRATYANYESGKTQPDFNTLIQIADYYKVSLDYLIEHEIKSQTKIEDLAPNQKTTINTLLKLNNTNLTNATSYINWLYYNQNKKDK